MTFGAAARAPRTPTLPQGETIATYGTYIEAQKAVDHLSDREFPVEHVTIVGADLRIVERVTGRLSYPRVAGAGAASGAWFGLFVGLLLVLFQQDATFVPLISAMLIGAAFGMLFSVISYSLSRGRRDFTSASQIVAGSYAVLCEAAHMGRARTLLAELGPVTGPGLGAQPPAPAGPQGEARPPAEPPAEPRPPAEG